MADGFYSKKIAEEDLEFTFSDDADGMRGKILTENKILLFQKSF